jgi:hypothetical protein
MENAEKDREGNSTETSGTNEIPDKDMSPPTILTSEVNIISLQRKLKFVVSGNSSSGTLQPEPGSRLKVWWITTP